jgi:hypothetical protein
MRQYRPVSAALKTAKTQPFPLGDAILQQELEMVPEGATLLSKGAAKP